MACVDAIHFFSTTFFLGKVEINHEELKKYFVLWYNGSPLLFLRPEMKFDIKLTIVTMALHSHMLRYVLLFLRTVDFVEFLYAPKGASGGERVNRGVKLGLYPGCGGIPSQVF